MIAHQAGCRCKFPAEQLRDGRLPPKHIEDGRMAHKTCLVQRQEREMSDCI